MGVNNVQNRLLVFPSEGTLVVGSDIHGNREDYLHLVDLFSSHHDPYLLLLGDLVHGPQCPADAQDFDYYPDESEFIVDHFMRLRQEFPDRVFSLLGNHELSHISGKYTHKFGFDAGLLEARIGDRKAGLYADFFSTFPLVAVTPCGVVFSHAAPSRIVRGIDDIIGASYARPDRVVVEQVWLRYASPFQVSRFLSAVSMQGCRGKVYVQGHDVARSGYFKRGPYHLILSTSFGIDAADKTYIQLDLSGRYHSVEFLEPGKELRRVEERLKQGRPAEQVTQGRSVYSMLRQTFSFMAR
jgi:hypothetical protein